MTALEIATILAEWERLKQEAIAACLRRMRCTGDRHEYLRLMDETAAATSIADAAQEKYETESKRYFRGLLDEQS